MIYAKSDNWYNRVKAWYGRNAGSWSEGDLWVKIDGTWRMMVPPNVVILYSSNSYHKGFVSDGTNGTEPLTGYYPVSRSTSILSKSGTSSHTAASHGASGTITTESWPHATTATFGFTDGPTTQTSHTHTIASHNHPSSGSNLVSKANLIPVVGDSKIRKDAVILANQSLSHAMLAYLSAYVGYNVFLSQTAGLQGMSSSHNHGSVSLYTEYTTVNKSDLNENSTFYRTHRHTANHAMQTLMPDPYYRLYLPYLVSGDMFFDELPSGSVVLMTTPRLPKGWSILTESTRLLRLHFSAGGTGGNSTHSHSYSVTTGTTVDQSVTGKAKSGTKTQERRLVTHSHSFTDTHGTAVNHMPPYIHMAVAVKS
jgi:hypothetical protein